jgi:hypothetical protein
MNGVDLMPFLKGEKKESPHDRLFWRTGGGKTFAVREGDWKLASPETGKVLLFNLKEDLGETKDLSQRHADVVTRLRNAYELWNRDNVAPLFESPTPKKKNKKDKGGE